MAVLVDLSNKDVRSLLERARTAGFLNYDQLAPFIAAGEVSPEDIEDTRSALWALGVELTEGMTQEERDREDLTFRDAMRNWVAQGNTLPSITGYGWAMLHRADRLRKQKGKS